MVPSAIINTGHMSAYILKSVESIPVKDSMHKECRLRRLRKWLIGRWLATGLCHVPGGGIPQITQCALGCVVSKQACIPQKGLEK